MANDLKNRPEFTDILPLVKSYFRDEFGGDIDLDDPTTAGMFAGVISKVCDKLSKTFEGLTNSMFVLKAHDSDLDDLGTEWEVFRRPASHAIANEEITAYVDDPSNPVTIPTGSDLSTTDGLVFHTLSDLTFDKPSQDDSGKTLTDDDGLPLETLPVQVISAGTGYAQNVQPNAIVNADSVDGLYSCTNTSAAQGGYDRESDKSLRIRIMNARSSSPSFSDNGIVDAINAVPDVRQVRLIDNREMSTDKYGNPGKSIHLYTVGGDDAKIANTLFNYLYPTTKTVGSITENVEANDGSTYNVHLDHAETVPVYVHLDLKVDIHRYNVNSSVPNIKDKVMDYFSTLNMGDPVLFSKLFSAGYSQSGVKEVGVGIGTDPNNLSMSDVKVDAFALATVSPDNISVNVKED